MSVQLRLRKLEGRVKPCQVKSAIDPEIINKVLADNEFVELFKEAWRYRTIKQYPEFLVDSEELDNAVEADPVALDLCNRLRGRLNAVLMEVQEVS